MQGALHPNNTNETKLSILVCAPRQGHKTLQGFRENIYLKQQYLKQQHGTWRYLYLPKNSKIAKDCCYFQTRSVATEITKANRVNRASLGQRTLMVTNILIALAATVFSHSPARTTRQNDENRLKGHHAVRHHLRHKVNDRWCKILQYAIVPSFQKRVPSFLFVFTM